MSKPSYCGKHYEECIRNIPKDIQEKKRLKLENNCYQKFSECITLHLPADSPWQVLKPYKDFEPKQK